jgi:hypothetical protein
MKGGSNMRVLAPGRVVARTGNGSGYSQSPYMALPLSAEWVDVPDYFRQITNGNPINDVIHAKIVDQLGENLTNWTSNIIMKNGTSIPFSQVMMPDKAGGSGDLTFSIWSWTTEQQVVELGPSPKYKGKKPKKRKVVQTIRFVNPICGTFRIVGYGSVRDGLYYTFSLSLDCLPKVVPQVADYRTMQTVRFSCGTTQRAYGPYRWTQTNVLSEWLDPLLDILEHQFQNRKTILRDNLKQMLYHYLVTTLRDHAEEIVSTMQAKCGTWQATVYPTTSTPYPQLDFRSLFVLNEPDIVGDRIDPLLAGNKGALSNHWIQYLCQHSLLKACESLPRLNDNSLSNLFELVGFIKALVVDHKIEMPKSLADAWLSYRYVYSTTKMDVQDAIKFVKRHLDLGTLDRTLVGRGVESIDYLDTTIVCRCSVEITPKQVDTVKRIWRALDQYGLTPDFYVIWDMIPYSFMVDWFLPISDIAGVWDANSMYFSGKFYKIENICYSLSYTREVGDYVVGFYTRWKGSVPSSLNEFYWLDAPSASNKTVGYRILDAASIFIG